MSLFRGDVCGISARENGDLRWYLTHNGESQLERYSHQLTIQMGWTPAARWPSTINYHRMWGVPKLEVPLNHPFLFGVFQYKPTSYFSVPPLTSMCFPEFGSQLFVRVFLAWIRSISKPPVHGRPILSGPPGMTIDHIGEQQMGIRTSQGPYMMDDYMFLGFWKCWGMWYVFGSASKYENLNQPSGDSTLVGMTPQPLTNER